MARRTASPRSRFRLAVLGAGQLGQTLVQGLLDVTREMAEGPPDTPA